MLTTNDLSFIVKKSVFIKYICIFLIILLLWQIISSINAIKDIFKDNIKETNSHIENYNIDNTKLSDSLKIELFGKYIPKQLNQNNIKQSLLDIHVIGIMYANDKGSSKVIMRFANGLEKSFKIGDTIPDSGGAIILHILHNEIIVSHDGVLERLSLPKNELIFDKPLKPLY